ncbi:wall-associated receptor kinase 5-like [Rutidosis leptorrhynchoides]|uniref:wall-associated receptor kinase 5-like n=1 Tax=Rutidosis leptorrhynchoides TaxID=125765 RepID=UPI003A996A99
MGVNDYLTSPIEVMEIRHDGYMRVNLPIVFSCYNERGQRLHGSPRSIHTSRFPFSGPLNKFVGVGCDITARLQLSDPIVSTRCTSNCKQHKLVKNGSCNNVGCCESIITPGLTHARIVIEPNENYTRVRNYSKCGYGFIVEKNGYNFSSSDLEFSTMKKSFPAILEWSVGNTTCEEAQKDIKTYMCKDNTVCFNSENINSPGYRCECAQGYSGNPYSLNGCQDVNECEDPKLNDCMQGLCKNIIGSFDCVCPKGQQGNGKRDGKCIPDAKSENGSAIRGISEGVAGAALTMIFVYLEINRRRKIKGKKDFFKQNGGIMLQKILFTCNDPVNKPNIFTEEELIKATNNFNDANLIGQGGYGTVYKGHLGKNTLVAIKKAKVIDQSQINQFVNELIILSQIDHPNIVMLVGCCLETHVPLLVYEYISNNNLRHHIDMNRKLTFEKRIKIAIETAEALEYMHSTMRIIHRDVKPSNILLNSDFTVKVSDFGISTFVPNGDTHLSTFVKGTIGYLDPEYFRTGKLTEKSDVYSFGVVLIELITGTEIHSMEISLTVYNGAAAYLTSLLKQNALDRVLDDELKEDKYAEVAKCVVKIAISCLDLEGKKRPTMNEVKQELEKLKSFI